MNQPKPNQEIPDTELVALCSRLTVAVKSDDVSSVRDICRNIEKYGKDLDDPQLRDSTTNETALHTAIAGKHTQVMIYLINEATPLVLMQTYKVFVKGICSEKTCLHQLTNQGDFKSIKLLLNRIQTNDRKEFVLKTVLSELEGQRPRHLSAIHIAALLGHTDIVEYFVSIGINVNEANNKNDTPVLWAARGNHLHTARSLIKMGADLNHQNDKGSTPFYWAVRYGFEEMASLLITEGKVDINQSRKLGLVSPIVLASALGYTNIVRLLLENGADVNLSINNGFTSLHYAAGLGNLDTIKVLIKKGAILDKDNDFGDTPLLLAAQEQQMEAVKLLALKGANIEDRNKEGKSAWDYVIEEEGNKMLKAYARCYQIAKNISNGRLDFSTGKTPLHIAARRADCGKLKCLIEMGADVNCADEGGNNFLHVAARYDITPVLETFINNINPNTQNADGDTVLHIAARKGHELSVNLLLPKVKLSILNALGETPLHSACKSRDASTTLIEKILTTIVKTHTWSLVDAKDKHGNTALHLAARFDRPEILIKLKDLNPRAANNEGETPLHVAARYRRTGVLEVFLELFRKDLKIQERKKTGESVLHVASCMGEVYQVELLINTGADLLIKDNLGNTVLHSLVLESVREPQNYRVYLNVLQCIVKKATKWWCMRSDMHQPDEDSELFAEHRRNAMVQLLTEVRNDAGFTVMTLAASIGAKDMFEEMLQITDVFYFIEGDRYRFDVTYLTPKTMPMQKKYKRSSQVEAIESHHTNKNIITDVSNLSCLDLIVRVKDLQIANEMLDIVPVQQMVLQYWSVYQYVYGLLMLIHIIYMSLLSVYAVPSVANFVGYKGAIRESPSIFPFILFLIWPSILLLYELYYMIVRIIQVCKTQEDSLLSKFTLKAIIEWFLSMIHDNIGHITSIMFSLLTITWFILYVLASTRQAYVLGIVLVVGWLFTMVFTEGFEAVHSFSIILKNIIVKDMTRFLFLYFFVMLGFSFCIQVLLYLAPAIAENYPTTWHIFFLVFGMMIGMDDHFFDADYERIHNENGYTGLPTRIVYLVYITLTTIILLNLVIAMMTDSYSEVKAREGKTWRVGSIKLALQIERTFPIVPKLFNILQLNTNMMMFKYETNRWELVVPQMSIKLSNSRESPDVYRALKRMNNDVLELKGMYESLEEKMDLIINNNSDMQRSGKSRKRKGVVYTRPQSALMKSLQRHNTEKQLVHTLKE